MKKISIILVIAMILSTLLFVTSCGKEGNNEDTKEQNTKDVVHTDAETEAETEPPYMDAVDYKLAEFRILAATVSEEGGRHFSELEGELGSDKVQNAIYNRDLVLEDKYNIEFVITRDNNWNTQLQNAFNSDDIMYHVATPGISNAVYSVQQCVVACLDDYSNFNFNNPWWNSNAIEQMTVLNRHYFAIGDFNLLAYDSVGLMFYNKTLAEAKEHEDIQDIVLAGDWTYETMMDIVKDVTYDMSGDGKMGAGDMYGLVGASYSALCFVYGGNYSFVVKDEDGIPSLRKDRETIDTFVQKIVTDHANSSLIGYAGRVIAGEGLPDNDNTFADGRQLLSINMLGYSLTLRDTGISYGIVPMPKWDELQDEYYTFPHQNASTTICIPANNNEYDMTSRILEDLYHYSYNDVLSYYVEDNLFYRTLEGDKNSYDIVLNLLHHLNCDIFFTYKMGITDMLRNLLDNADINIESKFTKYGKSYESQLTNIVAGMTGDK